jgi:hypothetical protein
MSDKAQQLFEEAMQANLSGNTSRSVDLLKQVVDEDPENLAAWEALARQLTDTNERRMALTTVLQLDPDNEYAKNALESVEKPKGAVDDRAELAPGIPMKQARTVGIGLVLYTVLVCGATLLITSAINGNKAARAQEVANSQAYQTQTQDAILAAATSVLLTATQSSIEANATLLAQVTATPTATPTRAFELAACGRCAASAVRARSGMGWGRCALARVFADAFLQPRRAGNIRKFSHHGAA